MKNKKRPLLLFLAAVSCLSVMALPAAAMEIPEIQESVVVSPRAEEVEWYYRVIDGKYQKRKWSITYGYWLTDWIDCVV
ncbi:hypothetical protein SDC9_62063 [bioreactor metagenome]|uniref:Uncharacterized protein n=1 Tax=bioreactor metagenome TaxID=1076179 RepID=A0A644XHK1_9ZZZZ